jgi:hypothetical protein
MTSKRLENRQKIIKIINFLVSAKHEVRIIVKGELKPFKTRVISIDQNHASLSGGTRSIIIIDKLSPEHGNNLIQSSEKAILKFMISSQSCTCSVKYIGISSMPPYLGFILAMPEVIEVEERRLEERIVYEVPDFLKAEICIGRGTKDEKRYELDVIDCAAHGLGMIVTSRQLELISLIKIGDVIKDIQFFASNAMLTIDGVVRHLTIIGEGKFKGGYYMGIESKDIISSCKSRK